MKRRTFIKGAFAVPVAAMVPDFSEPTSYGQLWVRSEAPTTLVFTDDMGVDHDVGLKMARALAESMMKTREQVVANVLNRAFGEIDG